LIDDKEKIVLKWGVKTMAKNCWEVMKCGSPESCPAYPDQGKICFSVVGTLCRGEQQGGYIDKIEKCKNLCKFYPTLENT
jgi:hypothetical protein